jgi:hypothetical protein
MAQQHNMLPSPRKISEFPAISPASGVHGGEGDAVDHAEAVAQPPMLMNHTKRELREAGSSECVTLAQRAELFSIAKQMGSILDKCAPGSVADPPSVFFQCCDRTIAEY